MLQTNVSVKDDEFLGDIMAELKQEPTVVTPSAIAPGLRVKKRSK